MMSCADACSGELPTERPTLWGSKPVRAAALAWVLVGLALVAGAPASGGWEPALFAAGQELREA